MSGAQRDHQSPFESADLARQEVPQSVLTAYNLQRLGYGIPKPRNRRLLTCLPPVITETVMQSGKSRIQLNLSEYRKGLRSDPSFS